MDANDRDCDGTIDVNDYLENVPRAVDGSFHMLMTDLSQKENQAMCDLSK
jgi:hypothetical protein